MSVEMTTGEMERASGPVLSPVRDDVRSPRRRNAGADPRSQYGPSSASRRWRANREGRDADVQREVLAVEPVETWSAPWPSLSAPSPCSSWGCASSSRTGGSP